MTTYSKRRGRRSLAAILAAMLIASVLAVVAGSPAQAANTSSEALTADGDREFGGRDRYDTALRLAKNYGQAKGGLGNVDTAFVASGYKLVDAVAVSGLAGYLDAPVLLNPSDSLHGGVGDYIEDYGVSTVYVLGGPAAVADSVVTALEGLVNSPTVSRISGTDRYATAAAIASKLGGEGTWCGTSAVSAILVNGGDVSLIDAISVGPITNRLQLPMLMTAADELPEATRDFLDSEDVEHVVIVGGTDSVSTDVASAVSDIGVDTVERVGNNTAAGTSVELAKLLTGKCSADLAPVSENQVALVNLDGLPDGIAAAPVLARSSLTPILVVGDTLPASVSDYLAATPVADSNGDKLHLSILALGGTAAVSTSVMDAAIAAASSADALTVQILASEDKNGDGKTDENDLPAPTDTQINLKFSDNVISAADTILARVRDLLEVNGVPAVVSAATHATGTGGDCTPDTITVTLDALKAGDTISVARSSLKLGTNLDQRTVLPTSLTVATPATDRTRPVINVIMIAGRTTAEIQITEKTPGTGSVTHPDGDVNNLAEVDAHEIKPARKLVDVSGTPTDLTVTGVASGVITFGRALTVGDSITIETGAVRDKAGNNSLGRGYTAIAARKSPRVSTVKMSELKYTVQAVRDVPNAIDGGTNNISISAKADGAAAGAAGNAWTFRFDVASTWDPNKAVDIDVRVSGKVVSVRFVNGAAKFGDLKAALEGNSGFASMFTVKLPPNTSAGCTATFNDPLALGTDDRNVATTGFVNDAEGNPQRGTTTVAVEVRLDAYVQTIVSAELAEDVFNEIRKRVNKGRADDAQLATVAALISDTSFSNSTLQQQIGTAAAVAFADISGPVTMVRYVMSTDNVGFLPQVQDLVDTAAGSRTEVTGDNPATRPAVETDFVLRRVVPHVALGYVAADDSDNTPKVDESVNGASQKRITRDANIKQYVP